MTTREDEMVEREGFEAWARNAVPQFSAAGKYVRDGKWSYSHNIVDLMWQCWNARALSSERDGLREALEVAANALDEVWADVKLGQRSGPAVSNARRKARAALTGVKGG